MPSNIEKFGFVASPKNANDIIEQSDMYHGSEKAAFLLGMMLTWNLMVDMIEETYHADDK
jgi:hypothetical protein